MLSHSVDSASPFSLVVITMSAQLYEHGVGWTVPAVQHRNTTMTQLLVMPLSDCLHTFWVSQGPCGMVVSGVR